MKMEFNVNNVIKKVLEDANINSTKIIIVCEICKSELLEDLEEIKGRKPSFLICPYCGNKISVAEILLQIKERKYGKQGN
jgi:hypothetical protein